jgi:hypothetical protein
MRDGLGRDGRTFTRVEEEFMRELADGKSAS